ncbi:MAG: type II toxin-antitoxin system HicB family antitoxin [Colwellia sp.]
MSKSNLLKYNGYYGTAEYSFEDQCIWGKIQFINDVVTYESNSADDIQNQFERAVNDYLETCLDFGKKPDKTMTGSFNVRIGEELHKQATIRACQDKVSLNEVTRKALEVYLTSTAEVHNHLSLNIHKDSEHELDVFTQPLTVRKSNLWAVENKLHA